MSRAGRTLLLFDIDGTLILSGRAGLRSLNRAFEDLYGLSDALDAVPIAGRTDRGIVSEALSKAGLPVTDTALVAVRDAYLSHLPRAILEPVADRSGVLDGVPELLDALESREDLDVGLLTGNFVRGAEIKLGHFGLWHRFPFGAFGDDHLDRRALVPVALARAARDGRDAPPRDRVIVIGDTPLDVDCAHAYGAQAIAVATGGFSRADLEQTGANLVVDSLAALSDVLRHIDLVACGTPARSRR
jgi:phosphoglycolate phosphatase